MLNNLSMSVISLIAGCALFAGGPGQVVKPSLQAKAEISIPIAIENSDDAPLRIESAFGGPGESRTVDGEVIRYFPFQKAVVRNVTDRDITVISIILRAKDGKAGAGLQTAPKVLKPNEVTTVAMDNDLLINGDIANYKISIMSATFADGSRWVSKEKH